MLLEIVNFVSDNADRHSHISTRQTKLKKGISYGESSQTTNASRTENVKQNIRFTHSTIIHKIIVLKIL